MIKSRGIPTLKYSLNFMIQFEDTLEKRNINIIKIRCILKMIIELKKIKGKKNPKKGDEDKFISKAPE